MLLFTSFTPCFLLSSFFAPLNFRWYLFRLKSGSLTLFVIVWVRLNPNSLYFLGFVWIRYTRIRLLLLLSSLNRELVKSCWWILLLGFLNSLHANSSFVIVWVRSILISLNLADEFYRWALLNSLHADSSFVVVLSSLNHELVNFCFEFNLSSLYELLFLDLKLTIF